MANQFKRGQTVRFETIGAGVRVKRRGTVVRTVDSGKGLRVEVQTKNGDTFPAASVGGQSGSPNGIARRTLRGRDRHLSSA